MTSFWLRFALFVWLLSGLSGSGLCRAPEPSIWRFVHPNAKALVGIQWSHVQESELGRWIQRRWIDGTTLPGSEFLKDVDQVLISSPGAPDGADQEPALLIAIRGKFDMARVETVLRSHEASKQMFGRIPLWRPQTTSATDPVFAIVDSETILAGDLQSIFSTIERNEREPSLERAKELAERYDCWALIRDNAVMHNFLLSSLAGKTLSSDSQGFEAGISIRYGLAMDVTLRVRTERSARLLQANLTRMIRLASFDKSSSRGFTALLDKMHVVADGSKVHLSLRISQDEAARNLNPVQLIAPPPNFTIKIEGLDDGPREVPFKP